ncbi:MAG: hydrogenase expression/formation protein [Anaeromyxobacter sp.]
MRSLPIVGPGSQLEEDEAPVEYLAPGPMDVFRAPRVPELPQAAALAETRAVLGAFHARLRAWRPGAPGTPVLDLRGTGPAVLDLVNTSLGEGEVSVRVTGPAAVEAQETAFAGVWRVREHRPDGALASDLVEAGTLPASVLAALAAAARDAAPRALPPEIPGLMNAPAVAREVLDRSARHVAGRPAHVINFTLLPMTPEDLAWLAQALGDGPVTILSRGYGNCRITATAVPHVFWVKYFNAMDQLILDTLEVVDVPEAALAAKEDLEDSTARLEEWLLSLEDVEVAA